MAAGSTSHAGDGWPAVLFVVAAFRSYNTAGDPALHLRHHRPARRTTTRGCTVKYLSLILVLLFAVPAVAEQRRVGEVPLGHLELNWTRPEVQQVQPLPEPLTVVPQAAPCPSCVQPAPMFVQPMQVQPLQVQPLQLAPVSVYRYSPWRTHRMNRMLRSSTLLLPAVAQ